VAARLDSARVLRERLPGAPGLAESYFYLGLVQQMTQHLDEAERWFGRALEEARATDDLVEQSNAHRHLGFVRQIAGDLTVAREHYQASLRLRESADAAVLVPFARVLLAQFEVETGGDTAAAIAQLEEAGRVAQRSRSRRGAMSAAFMLADLQAARGRLAAAGAALQRAEAEARAYGDPAALQDARRRRAALAGGPR
jgi:tetratricopeptide (TPR) repeat protein